MCLHSTDLGSRSSLIVDLLLEPESTLHKHTHCLPYQRNAHNNRFTRMCIPRQWERMVSVETVTLWVVSEETVTVWAVSGEAVTVWRVEAMGLNWKPWRGHLLNLQVMSVLRKTNSQKFENEMREMISL